MHCCIPTGGDRERCPRNRRRTLQNPDFASLRPGYETISDLRSGRVGGYVAVIPTLTPERPAPGRCGIRCPWCLLEVAVRSTIVPFAPSPHPIRHPQTRHAGKFTSVAGHEDQVAGVGLAGDEDAVGANGGSGGGERRAALWRIALTRRRIRYMHLYLSALT